MAIRSIVAVNLSRPPAQLLLNAPPRRAVLGLPPGSIRALLTLMTVGFIVVQTARGIHVSLLWFESLMIVLAHYFAHRRFVSLSPGMCEKLKAENVIEDEPHPLFLPKQALPTIIVSAFLGLAIYLARQSRLSDPVAVPVLFSVGSYFLGIGFGMLLCWWNRRKPHSTTPSWFEAIKACVTLGAVSVAIAVQLFGWQELIPFGAKLEAVPLALMLFYFGSR
jgi:hypothetical protein